MSIYQYTHLQLEYRARYSGGWPTVYWFCYNTKTTSSIYTHPMLVCTQYYTCIHGTDEGRQPETAVHHLPGLLCPDLTSCTWSKASHYTQNEIHLGSPFKTVPQVGMESTSVLFPYTSIPPSPVPRPLSVIKCGLTHKCGCIFFIFATKLFATIIFLLPLLYSVATPMSSLL